MSFKSVIFCDIDIQNSALLFKKKKRKKKNYYMFILRSLLVVLLSVLYLKKKREIKSIEPRILNIIQNNIQGLSKVWKPLNNFCKNENIKKR